MENLEQIEKDFDSKFTMDGEGTCLNDRYIVDDIKDFLRSKFTEYQEKVKETIKEMKIVSMTANDGVGGYESCPENKTLDEVLNKLSKL